MNETYPMNVQMPKSDGPTIGVDAGFGRAKRLERMLLVRVLIIAGLGVLVMVGLFLTNVDRDKARLYWTAMFIVFALVSIGDSLARRTYESPQIWKMLLQQILHWVVPLIAVRVLFYQFALGQMSADAVALSTLLILTVTCFLAGVHFEHSFVWVSAMLAAAAALGTALQAYIWMVALAGIGAIGIFVAAAVMLRRRHRAQATTIAAR